MCMCQVSTHIYATSHLSMCIAHIISHVTHQDVQHPTEDRAVDNFYSLGGHNRSECQCGLNFIGMPCTYKPTCIHNLI